MSDRVRQYCERRSRVCEKISELVRFWFHTRHSPNSYTKFILYTVSAFYIFIGFFVEPKEALGRQQSGVGRDVSIDDVTGQLEAEGC